MVVPPEHRRCLLDAGGHDSNGGRVLIFPRKQIGEPKIIVFSRTWRQIFLKTPI